MSITNNQPLAIDLYCGLGGWTEGLQASGYCVIGFDNERHQYGDAKYPAQLVIQDVLTLHGSQFKDAALIVASPPCQEFSYMAMPWSRAKKIADEYRSGVRDVKQLTMLFDACFRIQREASAAAGRHIPLIVENVRGAQEWVGRAAWHYGSFYLWGDVPALMLMESSFKAPSKNWNEFKGWDGRKETKPTSVRAWDGIKQSGISGLRANGKGDRWFQDGAARAGSKSNARKAASAVIAKIPFPLAQHIAQVWKP